jgi:hypothetical protein
VVRAGWPLNLMNAYNRQNILSSLTSGFQSSLSPTPQTDAQHQANGKRYSSWADVDFAIQNDHPLSIVILGTKLTCQCHVLVHTFRVTYSKAIQISQLQEPVIDDSGFVYHSITLGVKKEQFDTTKRVISFALLMLPNRDRAGDQRFWLLDKDWRFVGVDMQWRILH